MDRINLVDYRPELAAAVANMWNNSQDGWGGGNSIKTTEQVLQEESTSDALRVFLAMDGEQVAGYCSFGEYREDTGALYIPLLNVRPEYQGQKVGKLLVLRAVEETIKLGWPRLDLYTWAGNTKAIPLYKKCGFFWERRDDSTHLMNFIPTVLQTEAIADTFTTIDWYRDSTRPIEVEPDGRTENRFDFYEYSWQRDDVRLRVEFERRGRGLRLIETDDYLISATVEQAELVFGSRYPVTYRIVNKSGKPLHIKLAGENDKNIVFELAEEVTVEQELSITGHFTVGEIDREQSVWTTHPCVRANILINGKSALFQVGIVPKFPASLSITVPGTLHHRDQKDVFYLDLQNNLPETASFSLELPNSPFLTLDQTSYAVTAKAKERVSLAIPYRLGDFGFYEATIPITATLEGERSVAFRKKVGAAFTGLGARLRGETETSWMIYNGKYAVAFDKEEHEILLHNASSDTPPTFYYPRIGKPYSSEFSKKEPESVTYFEKHGGIGLTVTYRSSDFAGILLAIHTLLYGDGTVEQWHEMTNTGDVPRELSFTLALSTGLYRVILPYEDGFIETNDSQGSSFEYWESSNLAENWLFVRGDATPCGISWPVEFSPIFEGWRMQLEREVGLLAAQETRTTKPLLISMGSFTDWREFRAHTLQMNTVENKPLYRHQELIINERNPFVSANAEVEATLKDYKLQYLDGEVTLGIKTNGSAHEQTHDLSSDDEETSASFTLTPASTGDIQLVTGSFNQRTISAQFTDVIIPVGPDQIEKGDGSRDGFATLFADNGLIRLEAAPNFFPSLLSLTAGKKEWLDRSFPELVAKSWWNPYAGGIFNLPAELHARSLMKEKRSGSFATLHDTKGNLWEGIKISVDVAEQEEFTGLSYDQYFLLLPGAPVLCHTVAIRQQTGAYFHQEEWNTNIFLAMPNTAGSWVQTHNASNEPVHAAIGHEEGFIAESSSLLFGTTDSVRKMQVVTDLTAAEMEVYFNKEVTNLSISRELDLAHGDKTFLSPVFFVFTEEAIADNALHALRQLRF
ncbi:UNVERIFIED_CONTAM: GNAT superfamily N-acetyltransferase [Brevibacillus sp. OAP136]